jgi:hypothetical protein
VTNLLGCNRAVNPGAADAFGQGVEMAVRYEGTLEQDYERVVYGTISQVRSGSSWTI